MSFVTDAAALLEHDNALAFLCSLSSQLPTTGVNPFDDVGRDPPQPAGQPAALQQPEREPAALQQPEREDSVQPQTAALPQPVVHGESPADDEWWSRDSWSRDLWKSSGKSWSQSSSWSESSWNEANKQRDLGFSRTREERGLPKREPWRKRGGAKAKMVGYNSFQAEKARCASSSSASGSLLNRSSVTVRADPADNSDEEI